MLPYDAQSIQLLTETRIVELSRGAQPTAPAAAPGAVISRAVMGSYAENSNLEAARVLLRTI